MDTSDAAPKGVLNLQTVLRLCAWAAGAGLVIGLYLGTEVILAG